MEVPVFTRVFDIFHSFTHMSNQYSCFDLTYPLSNYSLSYNLIKSIGFWDTCPDAIGEDLHTTLKALWKTKMQVKGRPIYIPFNQVNVCTGKGYWEDCKARFWQAERHAKGVADVAYSFKMMFNQEFQPKNFLVFWFVIETFMIVTVVPCLIISINYQTFALYWFGGDDANLESMKTIGYFLTLISLIGTVSYLLYEWVKRKANTIIYKQKNESIFRMLEYMILFIVVLFFVLVPTFTIAAFSSLCGKQEYVVADKKRIMNE